MNRSTLQTRYLYWPAKACARLALATTLTAIAATLTACTTDDYEKGDGKYSLLTADFVRAYTDSKARVFSVMTDDGDSLLLSKPVSVKWISTPDTAYRAAFYHKPDTKAGTQITEAVSLGQVPTISPHKKDYYKKGIITDPVKLQSVWVSKNRRYLNTALLLMTGTTEEDVRQTVGFVADTLITHADNKRTLCLTLYHDQAGAPEYYSQLLYLSIPLAAIQADSVCLTVNTYDGKTTHTLPLTP